MIPLVIQILGKTAQQQRANASHRTVFGRFLIADGQLFEKAVIGKGASFTQASAFRHQNAMISCRSL